LEGYKSDSNEKDSGQSSSSFGISPVIDYFPDIPSDEYEEFRDRAIARFVAQV